MFNNEKLSNVLFEFWFVNYTESGKSEGFVKLNL